MIPHTKRSFEQESWITSLSLKIAEEHPEFCYELVTNILGNLRPKWISKNVNGRNQTTMTPPAWIRQISSLVSCLCKNLDHVFDYHRHHFDEGSSSSSQNNRLSSSSSSPGSTVQYRVHRLVRLFDVFAMGGPRLGTDLQQKQLQQGIKKYVGYIVTKYLQKSRYFPGVEATVSNYVKKNGSSRASQVLSHLRVRFLNNRSTSGQHRDVSLAQNGLKKATDLKFEDEELRFNRFVEEFRVEEIKKWREGMNTLKLGLNPFLEIMGNGEKQTLFCSLREPLRTMFKTLNAEFKKHHKFKGKV